MGYELANWTEVLEVLSCAMWQAGEEIVIARDRKPVVRLVPVMRGAFQIGLLAGQFGTAPDFLEAMDAPDLDLWEGGR